MRTASTGAAMESIAPSPQLQTKKHVSGLSRHTCHCSHQRQSKEEQMTIHHHARQENFSEREAAGHHARLKPKKARTHDGLLDRDLHAIITASRPARPCMASNPIEGCSVLRLRKFHSVGIPPHESGSRVSQRCAPNSHCYRFEPSSEKASDRTLPHVLPAI